MLRALNTFSTNWCVNNSLCSTLIRPLCLDALKYNAQRHQVQIFQTRDAILLLLHFLPKFSKLKYHFSNYKTRKAFLLLCSGACCGLPRLIVNSAKFRSTKVFAWKITFIETLWQQIRLEQILLFCLYQFGPLQVKTTTSNRWQSNYCSTLWISYIDT